MIFFCFSFFYLVSLLVLLTLLVSLYVVGLCVALSSFNLASIVAQGFTDLVNI